MTDYLNVGKIVNTQESKGSSVISKTDFPERYQKRGNVLMAEKKAPIELVVEGPTASAKNF